MIDVYWRTTVKWILFAQIIINLATSQKMGPYDFVIRTLENCERFPGDKILFESRINKFNRTTYTVTASVYLGVTVDDSLSLVVDLALFTNGGWKENFYKQKFTGGCSQMRQLVGKPMSSIQKNVGMEEGCPLAKGNYTIKAWPMKFELNFIPTFFYGKYRFNVVILKDEHRIGCLRTVVDVIPKKKH